MYDTDNLRDEDLWNHQAWQPTYGGYTSDGKGGYLTDHMNSGLLSSGNEGSGIRYTGSMPDEDPYSAYGIDPDLVDFLPPSAVPAFLSEQGQVNPISGITDTFGTQQTSGGGNPVSSVGQHTTRYGIWGGGISGDSTGASELSSTAMDTDLGSATKRKTSTDTEPKNFTAGNLGDAVGVTYIDSGNLTGDQGTGVEILGASKTQTGPTGIEHSSGSSDTREEGFGYGLGEVTGSSVTNKNAGANKLVDSTGTGNIGEEAFGSSMLGGGLGQYDSSGVGSILQTGSAQNGSETGRPIVGEWSGGSALEESNIGTGVPNIGESEAASADVVTEGYSAKHKESGSSMTQSSGSNGSESGKNSVIATTVVPTPGIVESTGNLGNLYIKNSSVGDGGLGESNLGSSAIKEGDSGTFNGSIKTPGAHVTSHGNADNIGAADGSNGSIAGNASGSHIGGGTGESSKAGIAGVGASGGSGRDRAGAILGNMGSIMANGSASGSSVASGTDTNDTNIAELIQPLLVKFPDSTVAVAEAFAGLGPDGKVQASSSAKVFDSSSKTQV
ncbi:uncharacterized transmembrane protein DDB_G0289901-like [Schistocerca piceifrons]|uniref:uncharacterized transmembrane protein DDB_G0289901-like n=1 Tax=Schistocerca piceifrons TaxID=274613 RepID=UPI001F5EB0FE|nr:uncharacterized transmembrane protein DDB_G0289901-like [Schistocerca piceifrons]